MLKAAPWSEFSESGKQKGHSERCDNESSMEEIEQSSEEYYRVERDVQNSFWGKNRVGDSSDYEGEDDTL